MIHYYYYFFIGKTNNVLEILKQKEDSLCDHLHNLIKIR